MGNGASLAAVLTGACTFWGLVGILALPFSALVAVAWGLMGIGGPSTMNNLVHTATSDIYPLSPRATALGWSNGTSFIGAFLGPTLGGVAIATGGALNAFSTFATAAAVCLVAVAGLYVADPEKYLRFVPSPAGPPWRAAYPFGGSRMRLLQHAPAEPCTYWRAAGSGGPSGCWIPHR
ncbi:MFS transporter [Paenarthrobacter ureafaciens]|uniref:MFS transporter n=1 Tax=Paenarthrobacter ureafaciens TaxID=37931 RepID=UPI00398AE5B0